MPCGGMTPFSGLFGVYIQIKTYTELVLVWLDKPPCCQSEINDKHIQDISSIQLEKFSPSKFQNMDHVTSYYPILKYRHLGAVKRFVPKTIICRLEPAPKLDRHVINTRTI